MGVIILLSAISVKRFKNIETVDMELARLNVLIGSNNAGKSSILQALQFCVSVAQTTSLENARWQDERLSTSLSPTQLVYSPLRDVSALAPGGRLREPVEHGISITFQDENAQSASLTVRRGRNKNINVEIRGQHLGAQLQLIENPYSIYVPGLAGIPAVEEYKNPGIVRRAAARGDANNVFRNILWLLKQDTDNWEQFLWDFNTIFPELVISVDFNPDRDEHINATIQKGDDILPIDAAGTGVLQAIQILSYINVYKPKLLILDEPDSHLHPNNQRKLAAMLVELSQNRDIQIILSTHSRHLVDELADVAKMHWMNNGVLVNDDEYDGVKVLMDIGALDKGDLLQHGQIKCVLLTEDSKTRAIETILEASGYRMQEVDVWSYKGCTKIDVALFLAEFIRKHNPGTTIIVHRDRDYYFDNEIQEFKEKIENARLFCFITEGTDVEAHFLNVDHINYLYPNISKERASEIIMNVTDEKETVSIEKFITGRSTIESEIARRTGERIEPAGRIALQAIDLYNTDKARYRHGKSILGPVKNELQQEIGGNIDLFRVSSFINAPELNAISRIIWQQEE